MDADMSMDPDPRSAQAVRVAKALGDATRFELLRAIASRAEISCQELTALFPIAQATVSHHLKILTEAGLVSARKAGPFHYYRAHAEALAAHARALARAFGAEGHVPPRRRPRRPHRITTGAVP